MDVLRTFLLFGTIFPVTFFILLLFKKKSWGIFKIVLISAIVTLILGGVFVAWAIWKFAQTWGVG